MDALDCHLDNIMEANRDWWAERPADRQCVLLGLEASWVAVSCVAHVPDLPSVAVHRLMMWQTARLYQVHALFLILAQQLDGGMALVRMAAELTRDVAFVGDSESRLDLWLRRSDPAAKKEYRRQARFDESDPVLAYVKLAYDLASTWGVHSHITSASHLEISGSMGGIARLAVDAAAIERSYRVWANAFAPIQLGCGNTFRRAYDAQVSPALKALALAGEALHHRTERLA